MPKSSMSTRQVLFYWFYVQTTDCLADGFLCHGRAITSVCVLSCKSQFVIILSYSLLPPIHDEHMHRDNRSFGNVDLCGNDLVVIDRLVPDLLLLLLLLLISRVLWIKRVLTTPDPISLLTRIWNSIPAFHRHAIAQMTKLFKRIPRCEYKL